MKIARGVDENGSEDYTFVLTHSVVRTRNEMAMRVKRSEAP